MENKIIQGSIIEIDNSEKMEVQIWMTEPPSEESNVVIVERKHLQTLIDVLVECLKGPTPKKSKGNG